LENQLIEKSSNPIVSKKSPNLKILEFAKCYKNKGEDSPPKGANGKLNQNKNTLKNLNWIKGTKLQKK
jgi:hypothetical protein